MPTFFYPGQVFELGRRRMQSEYPDTIFIIQQDIGGMYISHVIVALFEKTGHLYKDIEQVPDLVLSKVFLEVAPVLDHLEQRKVDFLVIYLCQKASTVRKLFWFVLVQTQQLFYLICRGRTNSQETQVLVLSFYTSFFHYQRSLASLLTQILTLILTDQLGYSGMMYSTLPNFQSSPSFILTLESVWPILLNYYIRYNFLIQITSEQIFAAVSIADQEAGLPKGTYLSPVRLKNVLVRDSKLVSTPRGKNCVFGQYKDDNLNVHVSYLILNMKIPTQKLKQSYVRLLAESNAIAGQIAQLENQIEEHETLYLQRSWPDGNVYLGWNKHLPTSFPANNHIKINIDAKEKIFSLSSISSPAFAQLGLDVDRQLSPYGEQRFQSKKKKKTKKRNASQMRRPRPIRKKRRR